MQFFDPLGLLVIVLIFVPLERLIPTRREQKIFRPAWPTDLGHFLISGVIIRAGIIGLSGALLMGVPFLVPAPVRAAVASQPAWLAFIEILILADLGFYFTHRAFHTFPWLWRFHAVHHSIKEMDWLAAHRVHPIDQILTKTVSLLPVMALGFAAPPLVAWAFLYQWQSLLIHSNARVKFGPLRWVLASPQFHHWHHANEQAAYDKNFAGQLPIIDWLFGTLHLPRGDDLPARYGVDDPVPSTYAGQLLYPFTKRARRGAEGDAIAAAPAQAAAQPAALEP